MIIGSKRVRHSWRELDRLDIQETTTYPIGLARLLDDRIDDRQWRSRKRFITAVEGDVVRVRRVQ